jgi:hypothetical protein
MDRIEQWLRQVEATARRPVAERVAELLESVRRGCQRYAGESWDQASERHAEEFIASLKEQFPGRVFVVSRPLAYEYEQDTQRRAFDASRASPAPVVIVERQKLRRMARRTTNFNYIFTVPGERPERLVLVAHYDTWRGPGADDNTTGEEITKQYLVADLRADHPPPLTHTYILAGSEECGLTGFTSQVLLALGLGLANLALAKGIFTMAALGVALTPLARFRFGVSGSREYVRSLSKDEMALVKSVVSVDSVGEGRIYIPESSLGANFVRAFIPFEGYAALNDVLKEAAHLNAIKYNTFIAGGTTDHVSFLEVNSSLRDRLGEWLDSPRLLGCHKYGDRKIPAAALVALCPGKASPLVFGGKLHTPADTPDRVYPGPLAEALRILDYWYHLMQGGQRITEPRDPDAYHYARLFRVRTASAGQGPREEYWLALKDAIEPNRRNINGIYRAEIAIADGRAVCRNLQLIDWGVRTRLRQEVKERLRESGGSVERVPLRELLLETPAGNLHFQSRPHRRRAAIEAAVRYAMGSLEEFMGGNAFLSFFLAAFLLAKGVDLALTFAFGHSMAFQEWFFKLFAFTLPATIIIQLWIVLWLIGSKIPTMIDNSYKHINKADNLRSLPRAMRHLR